MNDAYIARFCLIREKIAEWKILTSTKTWLPVKGWPIVTPRTSAPGHLVAAHTLQRDASAAPRECPVQMTCCTRAVCVSVSSARLNSYPQSLHCHLYLSAGHRDNGDLLRLHFNEFGVSQHVEQPFWLSIASILLPGLHGTHWLHCHNVVYQSSQYDSWIFTRSNCMPFIWPSKVPPTFRGQDEVYMTHAMTHANDP